MALSPLSPPESTDSAASEERDVIAPEAIPLVFWYQKTWIWVCVGAAACAFVLAMPYARKVYSRWTGQQKVTRAREALAHGEFQTAILNARGALATNPKDIEAVRILAHTVEKVAGPKEALQFRRQLQTLKPDDAENAFAIAETELKRGAASAAAEALDSLAPADRESARYHDLMSAIAWAQNDQAGSESHLETATKLQPGDEKYQLKLASLRLGAKTPELRAEALHVLEELAAKPATRQEALRALAADAFRLGAWERARALSRDLASASDATFSDRLSELSALAVLRQPDPKAITGNRGVSEAEFNGYLTKMQAEAAAKPETAYTLAAWMNEHFLSLSVGDWAETLPAEMVAKPPVCVAIGESYANSSNWSKLKAFTEKANWATVEPLRLALLARAFERLDDDAAANQAWSRALLLAQEKRGQLETLCQAVGRWNWRKRHDEALWKLVGQDQCPRWVADKLWGATMEKGDALSLWKLSKIVLAAEPKNTQVRNNYLSLALISHQENDAMHQMALQLFNEHPTDLPIATTYGFSLYRQGKPEKAVEVLAKFPAEKVREPWAAMYYGLFLAAAGKLEAAEEYIRLGAKGNQFPEQEALSRALRLAFDARAAESDGKAEASARAWQGALDAAAGNSEHLEVLSQAATKWGWNERAGKVALDLAKLGRCSPAMTDTLWVAAVKSGDASLIGKVSKLIVTAKPKDVQAQLNQAVVAMLARRDGDAPIRQIETFYKANAAQPEMVAAYAESLYRRGRMEEAIATFAPMNPAQTRAPRVAFAYGLVLAVAGQTEKAEPYLKASSGALLLPEERALGECLEAAFAWHAAQARGDHAAAETGWTAALVAAGSPDALELLARLAIAWKAETNATLALSKLADSPNCPRWALDTLWADAQKRRDTAQLYKVSRLLRIADPENRTTRGNFIWLSLLTDNTAEMPTRQAEELGTRYPTDPECVAIYALSLHKLGRTEKAIASLSALPAAKVKSTTRSALCYGVLLSAKGDNAQAREFVDVADRADLLPEERALLAKAREPVTSGAQ